VRELCTEFLSTAITQIVNQFTDNGTNYERSAKAKRDALEVISCYRENSKKRRSRLDVRVMKKPRFAEDPQLATLSGV
jgi:uncharacterized protein YbaA (DUF1428 family)